MLNDDDRNLIAARVMGGSGNMQEVGPLSPRQVAILSYHCEAQALDPYLMSTLMAFTDRGALEAYVGVLNSAMRRSKVLRATVQWNGLSEPVQVVWRSAMLSLEEIVLDPAQDTLAQLKSLFYSGYWRVDVQRAPLLRFCAAHDPGHGRWLGIKLYHYLTLDPMTELALDAGLRGKLLKESGPNHGEPFQIIDPFDD